MIKFESPPYDPDSEPEEFEINRLILIGNGFDRAHGMKTSYYDFITWYIKSLLLHFGTTENIAISVIRNPVISIPFNYMDLSLKEILEHCNYTDVANASLLGDKKSAHELSNYVPFRFMIKSQFLHHLLTHCCDYDWVDIENEYYEALKILLPNIKSPLTIEERQQEVKYLNATMTHLTQQLEEYLRSLPLPATIPRFTSIFFEKLKEEDFIQSIYNTTVAETLIVNFNYTHTVEEYFKNGLPENNMVINHIHGEINSKQNSIIFGFGDELDDDYPTLENEKMKGFLDKMKSFGYFNNQNYRNLIRFIEAREFQVFIMGHSCGLSDRTMLNMIVEHSNCWSIKIFHHHRKDGTNNYSELTQSLSRHFMHKQDMRRRIVSFDPDNLMPQSEE